MPQRIKYKASRKVAVYTFVQRERERKLRQHRRYLQWRHRTNLESQEKGHTGRCKLYRARGKAKGKIFAPQGSGGIQGDEGVRKDMILFFLIRSSSMLIFGLRAIKDFGL